MQVHCVAPETPRVLTRQKAPTVPSLRPILGGRGRKRKRFLPRTRVTVPICARLESGRAPDVIARVRPCLLF
jgi:hypothetical protein